MLSGIQKNPLLHRPDEEELGMANSKKPKPIGGTPETRQTVTNTGATTLSVKNVAEAASGSGQRRAAYNNKLGLKAMQAAEQQALAEVQTEEQDEDMSEAGETDNRMEVKSTKERLLVATAPADSIYGDTHVERLNKLRVILLTDRINCIDGPARAKDQNGETVYRVAVATQKGMDLLVSEELEDGTTTEQQLFTRMDNTRRVAEQERTVEVYGLHPRTDDFHIKSAMSQFGDIEKISTRPCTKGIKIIVRVTFRKVGALEKIQKMGRKWVFIGRDLARLSMVGNERITWELKDVAKIPNLPFGTRAKDLEELLGEKKAEFLTVPRVSTRNGSQTMNLREAFRLNIKEHIKAVKEYQKGGALKVTKQQSFAQIASGSGTGTNQKDGQNGRTQQQQQQQQQKQQQQQQQKNQGQQGVDDRLITALVNLQETITRMDERQRELTEQCSALTAIVLHMMQENKASAVPKEMLQAAGLSTELHRNIIKTDKGKGKAVDTGIPGTHVSIVNQHAETPEQTVDKLKIGSFSARGLLGAGKLEALCHYAQDEEYDVVDSLLVDRLLDVKHDDANGTLSDHKMVTAIMSVQGLITASSDPFKYKEPKGFRFQFRDTQAEQLKAFGEALSLKLSDWSQMREYGLKEPAIGMENNGVEDLRRVDIEKAWREYSKTLIQCAKDNLPGKIVGRAGLKPESELSVLHLVRDLGRMKKLARAIMQRRQFDLEDDARGRLIEEQTRFNEHARWLRVAAEREIDDMEEVPGWNESEEKWSTWFSGIKKKVNENTAGAAD
ncbi:hypothetical protein BGZ54_002515 [Gamsiella multidivaricata]|nr:hypothetical protein BGZ54_002515 [Gamsiella multidivaricata]